MRLIKLFGLGSVLGTVVSLGASQFWIADAAAQFRIQYLLMLLPAVAVCIWRRRRVLGGVGALALAINLWPVIPYLIPRDSNDLSADPGVTSQPDPFRLLVMNVLRTNDEIDATLKQVLEQNADFVFLMEVHPAWTRSLEQLSDQYPYQKLLCRQDYTGVAFLSKYKWDDIEIVDVEDIANPPLDIQFPRMPNRTNGFRLIATHPLPPFGPRLTDSRDRQLNQLAQRIRADEASLLVGDFNLTPWSPRFKQVLDAGQLRDASLGYGLSPTLTPLPTWMGGLKVDHVLVNDRVVVHDYRLESSALSDHCMVVIDFDIASQ